MSQGSGNIDFFELKKAGYDFVICRAGWGSSTTQKDSRFNDYVRLAHAAGLHVGAYWFIYARTIPEAQQNGKCFSEVCEEYKGILDMPLYIDYENDSTRYYQQVTGQRETKEFATSAISVAALEVEHAGWYTGYYVNLDYYRNHIYAEKLAPFALWLALWRDPGSRPDINCGLWQYSGDTRIREASGSVDLNYSFVDYPDVIRRVGLNGFTPEVNPDQVSGLDDISVGGHGIYGRSIKLFENGTWRFEE